MQSLALSTHATTSKPGAALPPLTEAADPNGIGGYGGQTEKVRKRVRLLVFSYSMYTLADFNSPINYFIFLISQYAYHPERRSRPTSSIPQSSRTSLILPQSARQRPAYYCTPRDIAAGQFQFEEDITNTSRHVSHLPIATRGLLRLLYILDRST